MAPRRRREAVRRDQDEARGIISPAARKRQSRRDAAVGLGSCQSPVPSSRPADSAAGEDDDAVIRLRDRDEDLVRRGP